MKTKLQTRQVSSPTEIQANFDRQAREYAEQHGKADRLLEYRLGLFRQMAAFRPSDVVLDIGCGNGHHLRGLCDEFAEGIGIDFSGEMVAVATERSEGLNLRFLQDDASRLEQIEDESVDVVICSGALEHMWDQAAVFRQINRVLRPGGRLAILTLNGAYFWYRWLAPRLGLDIQHYSTDHFLTREELEALAESAGFTQIEVKAWTFVPKGDMPGWVAGFCALADWIGSLGSGERMRGGLRIFGKRP